MRRRSLFAAMAALFLGLSGAAQAAPEIAASVLPNGRSVAVGSPATAYAVIANTGDQTATGCSISLAGHNQAPATLTYQTADANLQLTGSANTPVDIAASTNQFFVISVTPTSAYSGPVALNYACNNATALGQPGVNDLQLVAETGGTVTDILSVSLTPSNDGVARIATVGGSQVMTIAAVFPGPGSATANIRVTPEVTGFDATVANLEICETDSGGTCLGARAANVDTTFTQGTVKFFAIYVTSPGQGGIPLYPDLTRVRAVFSDQPTPPLPGVDAPQANEPVRSITSSALTAPAPANADTSGAGFYRFRIRDMINDPTGSYMDYGELVVLPDGTAVGAMTIIEGATPYRQVFTLSDGAFDPNASSGPIFGGTLNLLQTPDGDAGLSAPFTMTYSPATGMLGQFNGNNAASLPGVDAPFFLKRSQLAFTGLMMSQVFLPVALLTTAQLSGTYNAVDPLTLAAIGDLVMTTNLLTATLVLGGQSCNLEGSYQLQQLVSAVVLTSLVVTGCALNGNFGAVGVLDTVTQSDYIRLQLYVYNQLVGFMLLATLRRSAQDYGEPGAYVFIQPETN
ncbi:hypothetical protein V0U79_11815 [Hyphobacterium sp. HN65]|uniref:Choice-of-anchor D domain-containing protein n=1 Tax=Hyphobacterium lacteum TaxID=3116575 RepID=A0ABU7LTT4_9PROT|nr:hypothetical protein [Hyphobacterium sp. HN65]MEE2527056.1 hypothetical protein [Hyphobacterium sp. HN65]